MRGVNCTKVKKKTKRKNMKKPEQNMHIAISLCVFARYLYFKFKEQNFICWQLLSCVFFPSLKSCISIR